VKNCVFQLESQHNKYSTLFIFLNIDNYVNVVNIKKVYLTHQQ